VFLALTVPITTLAPVAGLLLDRLPTRPVLVTAAVVEAAVALGLAAASDGHARGGRSDRRGRGVPAGQDGPGGLTAAPA
jgi:hypothetical protein